MQDSLPVLDRATLQTLRSVGGSDALFQRVAKLFLSQAPVVAGNVVQLSDSRDLAALADAVHGLKSMCGSIGALAAAKACEDLEVAVRRGEDVDLGAKVSSIARELQTALSEIASLQAA